MLYESFLADGIPSFRKLFQFGWRLYGGFGQTLHRTRNMTKKDGEIFSDIGRTLHRIRNKTKKDGENFGILGGPSIGFGEKLPMDGAFY